MSSEDAAVLSEADLSGSPDPVTALLDAIFAQALRRSTFVAISDGALQLTYEELLRLAGGFAERISLTRSGGPVGILLPNGTSYVVAVLALLACGRTAVPLDPRWPESRLRRIVDHAELKAVIVDGATQRLARGLSRDLRLVEAPRLDECMRGSLQLPTRVPNSLFAIVYTSGSTGEPKGVCKPTASLYSRARASIGRWGLSEFDRIPILQILSIGNSFGLCFATLLAGARLIILDLKETGMGGALALLSAQRPNLCITVPSLFRALFSPDTAEVHQCAMSMRVVELGGEPLRFSDVDLYRRRFSESCRLWFTIGTTETGRYASLCIDHDTPLGDRPVIPVGYASPGIELQLISDDGIAVRAGEIGEIVVSGSELTSGYWQNEALSRARYSASPRHRGLRTFRTGDFGRMLPNGMLEFVGRRDRQIKILGNTVHLSEVEAVIARCPGIMDVSLVARAREGGIHLVAYCVASAGGLEVAGLKAWCIEHLAPFMRPAEIVPLAALPRLANGKVDLIGLAHMDHERADRASPEVEEVAEPGIASAAGGAVRDCWSRCISARSWQLDSRFDDAGGDSLNAMELLLALERRLRRKLPVGLLTPDMRPSELTARLNDPLRSATHTHEDEPTIVFVPNSFGANLIFAEIIARMREHFEVRHTDHREIIEQAMRPVDAEQYIALVQRTAVTGGARKRLWFVGYAGGGRIAAEVARRLIAQGVPVEFVAVLDGQDSVWREARTRHPANRSLFPPLRDRIANDGGLIAFVITRSLIRFVLLAMRLENYKMMQLGVRILALLGLREGANYALRLVLMRVRNDALGELPKKPLPMPITLFVSAASHPSGYVPPADRGWSPHCTGVSVVEIEGDRMAMLAGEGAAAIITALRSADERLRVRKKA